ncbi:L,D-transpeptidase family protein [Candidatus Parcubacteria bacterium]|nr:L,D-transpeptidase family protein [Candidatus Parcubacteria bacterium]
MKKFFVLIFILVNFFPAFTFAAQSRDDQVQLRFLSTDGTVNNVVYPFDSLYRGSGSVAVGDLGSDGVSEIVIGAGAGSKPEVFLYRKDGSFINSFLVYGEEFMGGVNLAIGDVDGDGVGEIITGAMYGGGPHVRIFDGWGNLEGEFFAYAQDFRGGVNVAVGDLNGDGVGEIITGPGVTGGPHVKVFNNHGDLLTELFVGSASDNSGTSVAMLDVNEDGDDELIVADAGPSSSVVQLYDWQDDHLFYVLAIDASDQGSLGLNLFAGDADSDGMDEVGVGSKGNGIAIAFYEMTGRKVLELNPFSKLMGASAGVIVEGDPLIIALGTEKQTINELGKYIYVDVQRQTLYTYENGSLVKAFLVSTGRDSSPSPVGVFDVIKKILMKNYQMNYGEGDPRNYFIPDVKYNLQFQPIYYIHSAYWHNNFGSKMSGGCVNTSYDNAEWIYYWAEVGTPVEVR